MVKSPSAATASVQPAMSASCPTIMLCAVEVVSVTVVLLREYDQVSPPFVSTVVTNPALLVLPDR